MFVGFNLKIQTFKARLELKEYYDVGKELYEKNRQLVKKSLKEYIYNNIGRLNGTQIQNDWFPTVNADIFLSHSHMDEELVISLAGWLYKKFGLISFIDSCVWGYANDLLKDIDDEYSSIDSETYYYEKCTVSSSHVHMMLAMALFKMIDKTECLFFINTPSSVDVANCIENGNKTISPWIYAELEMSRLVRKRNLLEYRSENKAIFESYQDVLKHDLVISYDVILEHLINLSGDELLEWERYKIAKSKEALDILYFLKNLLKDIGD